jgi:2,4-dienoyl-CoA reductase-like NADH-dependent reductase (Old Yellow Enzyme family)
VPLTKLGGRYVGLAYPYFSRRTDNYGGSWENRTRFIVETLAEMRKVADDDFPILVRFCADELPGDKGITVDASVKHFVPVLGKAGVDAIGVSQGSVTHFMQGPAIPPYYSRGCFISYTGAIKRATKHPVIGVGRIPPFENGNSQKGSHHWSPTKWPGKYKTAMGRN